jgi:hypothetical protein
VQSTQATLVSEAWITSQPVVPLTVCRPHIGPEAALLATRVSLHCSHWTTAYRLLAVRRSVT